jgi:hypothetical protein
MPIIVSNYVLPLVLLWENRLLFRKKDSPFEMRTCITLKQLVPIAKQFVFPLE